MYNDEDYCMWFTNEEIEEYLLQPLRENTEIVIKLCSGIKKDFYSGLERIKCVFFDGNIENFSISLYGHQTSIFISDETPMPNRKFTFNDEFMFIDDAAKEHIVSSDTQGNVVYEGTLKDRTHKEILFLLCEFVKILNGAKNIKVEETEISQEGWQYPKCKYVVKITNEKGIFQRINIENILFVINEKNE